MLSKCANPRCSTPLVYLREGKIFMMEQAPAPQPVSAQGQVRNAPVPRVEHFWLCGPCSAEMTLIYDQKSGVTVVPKNKAPKTERAAS